MFVERQLDSPECESLVSACDVISELTADSRDMLPFVSGEQRPHTRQSVHNSSATLNGYKRADDHIQFGKCCVLSLHLLTLSPTLSQCISSTVVNQF